MLTFFLNCTYLKMFNWFISQKIIFITTINRLLDPYSYWLEWDLEIKTGSSPYLLQWPKNLALRACWSPEQTGICCEWVARLPPPYTSGSHHQRSGGVDLQRSHSGCSWEAQCCVRDSARSGTLLAHQSVPDYRAAGEGAEEELGCGRVVWMWAPPWSSCVGSLDPLCHAGQSDMPGHPCRYERSGARSCCTLAAPCRTPLLVQSLWWRPKIRSYTWGSCTAGSLSGRNKIQVEWKKQNKGHNRVRNLIQAWTKLWITLAASDHAL